MPLWDLGYEGAIQASPTLTGLDSALDYVPMWDASAGLITKTLLKNQRGVQVFTLSCTRSIAGLQSAESTSADIQAIRFPYAFTVISIIGTMGTANSSGSTSLDIRKNNTTMLSGAISMGTNTRVAGTVATTSIAQFDLISSRITVNTGNGLTPQIHLIGYES